MWQKYLWGILFSLINMAGMADRSLQGDGMVRGRAWGGRGLVMDQCLALGACTPQIAPPAPPPPPTYPPGPPPPRAKSPPDPPW